MDNFNFRQEAEKARSAELPGQGYSMQEQNPGYDNSPEATIAMLSKEFKNARGQDRRALFNQAFKIARQNGLEVFDWATGPIAVELAEHTQKVAEVAQQATQVAQAQHEYISKGQATIHDEPKAMYDIKQLFEDTRPPVSLLRSNINDVSIGEPGVPQFGAMKNIFDKM